MIKTPRLRLIGRLVLTGVVILAAYVTGTDKPKQLTSVSRRLDDFRMIRAGELTREYVVAIWGPPDALRGSGVDYRAYVLEDGQELWFKWKLGPPRFGHEALLFSPST